MTSEKAQRGARSDDQERDFLAGKLLIAMPNMGDPRFERSVIFMCSHDADHAMGVIVNKPLADVDFSDLLEQLGIEADGPSADAPVFFGGPVQTERGIVLHTLDYTSEATIELGDDIGITATRDILIDISGASEERPPPRRALLAIGHAGWGPGQLEQEITMNAWVHCDADEAIIFDGASKPSWRNALSKLGVSGAMFSPEWAEGRDQDTPLN